MTDPKDYENWEYNDMCAQEIIREHVEEHQKHIRSNCSSAEHIWTNLVQIHQPTGYRSITNLIYELHQHTLQEGDDIIAHHKAAQEIWNKIVLICPEMAIPYTP